MKLWSTGGEHVAATLDALGVDCVVSIPGSQTLPIWDALADHPRLRLVVPRSERSGAFMAEGYGQAAGFPALLLSTLGPGVANELVGLQSAKESGTPVLCVTPSQPPAKRDRIRDVFQGLDHGRFLGGACKHSLRVEPEEEGSEAALESAFIECLHPPCGPVRVDIAFPVLFRRRLTPPRRVECTTRRSESSTIVVVRDPSVPTDRLWEQLTVHRESARVLAPGLDLPGTGLPFALGVKLACPDAPVVLVIDGKQIPQQLDSLAVAQLHGMPVAMVGEALQCIAEIFGVNIVKAVDKPSSCLTILTV